MLLRTRINIGAVAAMVLVGVAIGVVGRISLSNAEQRATDTAVTLQRALFQKSVATIVEGFASQYSALTRNRDLPEETLVLPSHDWPFRGLSGRIDYLTDHHEERLVDTLAACEDLVDGVGVLRRLFTRKLDDHQLFFAIGESLAHVHHLIGQGRVQRETGADGIHRFQRVA